MLNALKVGFKREYWEYKRVMLVVPAILSALIIIAAIMANLYATKISEWVQEEEQREKIELAEERSKESGRSMAEVLAEVEQEFAEDEEEAKHIEIQKSPKEFIAIYIAIAWIVGLYYMLSALYVDRRDNSVLYWKSLPVSETRNVITKFAFGAIAFAAVAVVAAWVSYLILDLFNLGAMTSEDGGMTWDWNPEEQGFKAVEFLFWPFHALAAGLLWGAPVFAFLLFISAVSKRSSLLVLVVSLIVVRVLEGIFFRSNHLVGFLGDHVPMQAMSIFAEQESFAGAWSILFNDQGASLLLGLIVAAAFLAVTVWLRNHRFEAH